MGQNAGLYGQAAGLGAQVGGAYAKSLSTKRALELQAGVDAQNAQVAEWQAESSLQRGASTVQAIQGRAAQLKGTQRARLAANGVSLDSGSALDILTSTDVMKEGDVQTAQSNAEKEAWAYRVQASNATNNAALLRSRANSTSPLGSAFATLLTGAGSVAKSWYKQDKSIGSAPTDRGGDLQFDP